MSACVLNVNAKMQGLVGLNLSLLLLLILLILFPPTPHKHTNTHCVFFNRIVSRLLLSVTAAGSAALSDADADSGAMGRLGAGREIHSCKIPYALCVEVRM